MSAAVSIPWSLVLADVSASLSDVTKSASADALQLHQPRCGSLNGSRSARPESASSESSLSDLAREHDLASPSMDMGEMRLPNVADWKGTLDLVTGMTDVAGDQRKRLREQTDVQQRALEKARRELDETLRRLRASEQREHELQAHVDTQLHKIQADLDARVEETRAETEARVHAICAQNASLIQATEKQVRAAERRALTAEKWLEQLDMAARNLLLNGSMNRTDRRYRKTTGRQQVGASA